MQTKNAANRRAWGRLARMSDVERVEMHAQTDAYERSLQWFRTWLAVWSRIGKCAVLAHYGMEVES